MMDGGDYAASFWKRSVVITGDMLNDDGLRYPTECFIGKHSVNDKQIVNVKLFR